MFKKIISVMLTVVMVLALLSAMTVSASADNVPKYFLYEVQEDGTAWITGYNPTHVFPSLLTIPSEIDGYTVTGIKEGAFMSRYNLWTLTLPAGIKYIGYMAFYDCMELTKVDLNDGLEHIGEYAFENCPALNSVTVPKTVSYIGEYAFGYTATQDENDPTIFYDVPQAGFSMRVIKGSPAETYAINYKVEYNYPNKSTDDFFYTLQMDDTIIVHLGKIDVTDVVIPAEIDGVPVTAIDDKAFANTKTLTSVVIPPSVKTIGSFAFFQCPNLSSVTLNEGLEVIYGYAFENCPSLKSLTIPKSTTGFGRYCIGSYDEIVTDSSGNSRYMDFYYTDASDFTAYVYRDSVGEQLAQYAGIPYQYVAETEPVLGDVDGSGEVDIVDALIIQRRASEITTPYEELIDQYGDTDGSGEIDIVDALLVQRFASEIPTPYPIGEMLAA